MRKVLVTMELQIDEMELEKISNYEDEYKQNVTLEKWVNGLEIIKNEESMISIGNDIEYYYNANLGDSQALKSIEVKEVKIIE